MPADIVTKVSADVMKSIQQADARERIGAAGVEIVPAAADEFAAYVASEHAKWAKVVKDSGAKID
jgi:tripartite-type tricarboxylate transporter receptor subunit TctC